MKKLNHLKLFEEWGFKKNPKPQNTELNDKKSYVDRYYYDLFKVYDNKLKKCGFNTNTETLIGVDIEPWYDRRFKTYTVNELYNIIVEDDVHKLYLQGYSVGGKYEFDIDFVDEENKYKLSVFDHDNQRMEEFTYSYSFDKLVDHLCSNFDGYKQSERRKN